MKRINLLLFAMFSIAILTSCTDPCDDVNCLNEGICDDGTCECIAGFEGKNCEILTRDSIAGNFAIASTCDDGFTPTDNWAIGGSSSASNEILINNFHKPTLNIIATITGPTTFDIKEQFVSDGAIGYTFSGTGTIEDNNKLNVSYQAITDSPATTINCSIVATR